MRLQISIPLAIALLLSTAGLAAAEPPRSAAGGGSPVSAGPGL